MKLWEKVNNVTGNASKARFLVENINIASKWLVNSLPERFLWSVATDTSADSNQEGLAGWDSDGAGKFGTGSSIAFDRILGVYRLDDSKKRLCSEVKDAMAYAFDEASSLMGATNMFPKYYKLNGRVYIKPDPDYNSQTVGGGNPDANRESYTNLDGTDIYVDPQKGDKGVIVYAAPPLIDENTDSWVLVEYENIIIMYAGALDSMKKSSTLRDASASEISTISSTLLSQYQSSYPMYSYPIAPAAKSLSLQGTIPTFDTNLTYDPPAFPAIVPFIDSDNYSSESLVTTSIQLDVSDLSVNIEPLVSDLQLSLETGAGQNLDMTVLDLDLDLTGVLAPELPSEPDISSVSLSLPSPPVIEPITYTPPSGYTMDKGGIDSTSLTGLPILDMPVFTFDTTNFDEAMDKAKKFVHSNQAFDDGNSGTDTAFGAGYELFDEDTEQVSNALQIASQEVSRAGSELNKQSQLLSDYTAKVQSESSKFSSDLNKYQQDVSKRAQDASTKLGAYRAEQADSTSNYQAKVSQYQQDIARYQAETSTKINEYQQRVNILLQDYSQVAAQRLARSQAEWGARVQKATQKIQKAGVELTRITNKLQIERAKLEEFQAKIQVFQQKAQVEISKFENELNKRIQKYNLEFQNEVSEFSAKVNQALSKYQSESQHALAKYTTQAQQSLAEFGAKLQASMGEFSAKVDKYVKENQQVIAKFQAEVNQDIQRYNADIQAETAKFSAKSAEAKKYLDEASLRLQVAGDYTQKSEQVWNRAQTMYQWAMNELKSATGATVASPEQQSAQRTEEGKSS